MGCNCGIKWRVCWGERVQEVQSLEAAIFAHRSIEESWIEVWAPSAGKWLRVQSPDEGGRH